MDIKEYQRQYYINVTKKNKDKYKKHLQDALNYYYKNKTKRLKQHKEWCLRQRTIESLLAEKKKLESRLRMLRAYIKKNSVGKQNETM